MDQYFDKVKAYLIELDYDIISVDEQESIFIVNSTDGGIYNLVVDCEDPILIIEQYMFDISIDNSEAYKTLLKMNREVVHGAFVLDETGKKVIFRDTLQLENLDLNEIEATLNSLELLLSEFSAQLVKLAN
jgi:hypothetical protein